MRALFRREISANSALCQDRMLRARELLKQESAEANCYGRAGIYDRFVFDANLQIILHIRQCDLQHCRAGIQQLHTVMVYVDLLSLGAVHQAFIRAGAFSMVARFTASLTQCFNRTHLMRDAGMRGKGTLRKQPHYEQQPGQYYDFTMR